MSMNVSGGLVPPGAAPRFGVSLPRPDLGGALGRLKKVIQRDTTSKGFTRINIQDAVSLKTVENKILGAFDQLELTAPRTEEQIVKNVNDTFLHDVGNTTTGKYKSDSYYGGYHYHDYWRFVTGKVTYGLKPKAGATTNIASVRYTVAASGKSSGFRVGDKDRHLTHLREELVVETKDKHRLYYQKEQKNGSGLPSGQLAVSTLNKRLNDKIRSLQEQGRLYLQNKDQIEQDERVNRIDRVLRI